VLLAREEHTDPFTVFRDDYSLLDLQRHVYTAAAVRS